MASNNFQLTLDTIAPTGSIHCPNNQAINTNTGITLSISIDSAPYDARYMKIWYDSHSNISPDVATEPSDSDAPWTLTAATYFMQFAANGVYYAHMVLLDDVGNKSAIYTSEQIVYDTVSPVINEFYAFDIDSGSHSYTNGNGVDNNKFKIHAKVYDVDTAGMSGLQKVIISGNFQSSELTVNSAQFNSTTNIWEGELYFNTNATHGTQTLNITAYDNAGNTATASCTIVWDPDKASGNFTLKPTELSQDALVHDVNAAKNSFVAIITETTQTHDIRYYQLYGDIAGYTTATNIDWPQGANYTNQIVVPNLSFTTTPEGTKTVYVRLIDKAGNITDIVHDSDDSDAILPQSWVYDNKIPTVSITATPTLDARITNEVWIASTSGTGKISSTVINYTCVDSPATNADVSSGVASGYPKFYCNSTEITGISGGSFTFSKSTAGAVVGKNTLKIIAYDIAGNYAEATCDVWIEDSFELQPLQLLNWELYANIYREANIGNLAVRVTNNTAPTSGRKHLITWINGTAVHTTASTDSAAKVDWSMSPQDVAYANIDKDIMERSTNYVHVKAISNVGNVAYAHLQFTYDKTAPTYTYSITQHTSSLNNTIVITSGYDNLSGLDMIKVEQKNGTNLASGPFDWTLYSKASEPNRYDISLALDNGNNPVNGDKYVIVKIRDKAGNITTEEILWEYDTRDPAGSIVLKEIDGTTNKTANGPYSAINSFKAQLTFTTPDPTDKSTEVEYLLYGDFARTPHGTATAAYRPAPVRGDYNSDETYQAALTQYNTDVENGLIAQWTQFSNDENITTILTDTLYCTDNPVDGDPNGTTKTIYFQIRDNAGNLSSVQTASFIYNPGVAELIVKGLTHNRISCSHALRKTGGGTGNPVTNITGDYADKVSFTVTCTQSIAEWKVAAYSVYPVSGTSTISGETVTPMVMHEAGSSTSGYHQTPGSPGVKSWTVEIDGTDYRNALGGSASTNVDGLHYIVVFGKNLAGTWTVISAEDAASAAELAAQLLPYTPPTN